MVGSIVSGIVWWGRKNKKKYQIRIITLYKNIIFIVFLRMIHNYKINIRIDFYNNNHPTLLLTFLSEFRCMYVCIRFVLLCDVSTLHVDMQICHPLSLSPLTRAWVCDHMYGCILSSFPQPSCLFIF